MYYWTENSCSKVFPDTIINTEPLNCQRPQILTPPDTESPEPKEQGRPKSDTSQSTDNDANLPLQTDIAGPKPKQNVDRRQKIAASPKSNRKPKNKHPTPKSSKKQKNKASEATHSPYTTLWACTSKGNTSLEKIISNTRKQKFTDGSDRLYKHFENHRMWQGTTDENAYKFFDFDNAGVFFITAIGVLELRFMIEHRRHEPGTV